MKGLIISLHWFFSLLWSVAFNVLNVGSKMACAWGRTDQYTVNPDLKSCEFKNGI